MEKKGVKRGLFITFEGGEGAGKTSVMRSASSHLSSENFSIIQTREPGGTPFGKKIRNLLLHEKESHIDPKAELLLFLADRSQHVKEVILPHLNRGEMVLCDRFTDSTKAYQGMGRKIDPQTVELLCSFAASDLIPDLTFFLDIDPIVGLQRAKGETSYDRIEQETLVFHEQIREAFCSFAKKEPSRFCIIDASHPFEIVCKKVIEEIKKRCVLY